MVLEPQRELGADLRGWPEQRALEPRALGPQPEWRREQDPGGQPERQLQKALSKYQNAPPPAQSRTAAIPSMVMAPSPPTMIIEVLREDVSCESGATLIFLRVPIFLEEVEDCFFNSSSA